MHLRSSVSMGRQNFGELRLTLRCRLLIYRWFVFYHSTTVVHKDYGKVQADKVILCSVLLYVTDTSIFFHCWLMSGPTFVAVHTVATYQLTFLRMMTSQHGLG
jgi:hypothetical protein